MSNDSEFVDWISELDEDLEREYASYDTNDDGYVVYADLHETDISDDDFLAACRLERLKDLRAAGNPDITSQGLKELASLALLECLDVSFTNIDDAGLEYIASLPSLLSLNLAGLDGDQGRVTDVGVQHLAKLKNLEELRLNSSLITDTSIETLSGLLNLKLLDVSHTEITDDGFERLMDALPACQIERDLPA